MTAIRQTIGINGPTVHDGTALYDTKVDRGLWIAAIEDYEIEIGVVDAYVADEAI